MLKLKRAISRFIPEPMYLRVRHRIRFGRWPSIKSPKTFNEQILKLMIDREESVLRRVFADKYGFRSYVAEKIGSEHLPKLIKVIGQNDDFNLDDVAGPFVMKATHGSSLVKIVRDRAAAQDAELESIAKAWLSTDYYWSGREYVYRGAERRLLLEELLKDPAGGGIPPDYKFFVFRGSTRVIQVDLSRFDRHERLLLTTDWSPIDVEYKYQRPAQSVPRPPNLEKMLSLAASLAGSMSFVRVDLYDLGDRILVGELTNFPEAGNGKFKPDSFDYELGSFLAS